MPNREIFRDEIPAASAEAYEFSDPGLNMPRSYTRSTVGGMAVPIDSATGWDFGEGQVNYMCLIPKIT